MRTILVVGHGLPWPGVPAAVVDAWCLLGPTDVGSMGFSVHRARGRGTWFLDRARQGLAARGHRMHLRAGSILHSFFFAFRLSQRHRGAGGVARLPWCHCSGLGRASGGLGVVKRARRCAAAIGRSPKRERIATSAFGGCGTGGGGEGTPPPRSRQPPVPRPHALLSHFPPSPAPRPLPDILDVLSGQDFDGSPACSEIDVGCFAGHVVARIHISPSGRARGYSVGVAGALGTVAARGVLGSHGPRHHRSP